MLKWLLITSITLVSTSMLIFVSEFLAVLSQAELYYGVDRSSVLLLSNSFNIFYLIITPCIFYAMKKHYSALVSISVILSACGFVGRYLCSNNYSVALFSSILVAIGHIPIITAPYGLLDLFPESKKGYAASIPLFLPTLGINYAIYYGMSHIIDSAPTQTSSKFNGLNLEIAIIGTISCMLTLFLIKKLRKQIRKINQDNQIVEHVTFSKIVGSVKNVANLSLVAKMLSWATILGINWTYGSMFQIFLEENGMSNKDNAMVGLYANLSSVVFSNLGTWISNRYSYSNKSIIFSLNVLGFISSMFICLTAMRSFQILNSKIILIILIVALRAGFSSFVSLALIQMGHQLSPVLISSIFFYIANAANLGGNFIVDKLSTTVSLLTMSFIIWVCIFCAQISDWKIGHSRIKGKNKQLSRRSKQKIKKQEQQIRKLNSIEQSNLSISQKI